MTLARKTAVLGQTHPDSLMDRLIAGSGIKPTDHITIAGRRAITFALDLCRRGYPQVTCRAENSGSAARDKPTHSLWIVNVPSETELVALIGTLGRHLRVGGILVLVFEASISPAHATRLRQVLDRQGFVAHRESWDRWGRTLLFFYGRTTAAHSLTGGKNCALSGYRAPVTVGGEPDTRAGKQH